jgi:hypothetical protein
MGQGIGRGDPDAKRLDFDNIRLNHFVLASEAKQSIPALDCFAAALPQFILSDCRRPAVEGLAMTIHLDVIPLWRAPLASLSPAPPARSVARDVDTPDLRESPAPATNGVGL